MSGQPTAPQHAPAGLELRGRIGPDHTSGYWPAPGRYLLHLALSCPDCLGLAITYRLCGEPAHTELRLLPSLPDAPGGGYRELSPAYAASAHGYPGPLTGPLLVDGWTGRGVSNQLPDIGRDLAARAGEEGQRLYPAAAEAELTAVAALCEEVNSQAQRAGQAGLACGERELALDGLLSALGRLDRGLADPGDGADHEGGGGTGARYALGDELTAADVRLWTTLLWLDLVHRWHLDAAAVQLIASHRRLWAYARRLLALPAFHTDLRTEEIEYRHHHGCRGRESAGAAVPIIDWAAPRLPASAVPER